MELQPEITRKKHRIANAVFFFISGFGYAVWASRIPTVRDNLQLSDSTLGSLLLAMPIGLICTLPLTNYLLGKFSSNRIMLIGSLVFSLALSLTGFVTNVWQLAVMLFCFGSSRNLLNISMNAQAVGVQKLYKNKSIITSFHGIWSIAGFAGAALGYFIVSAHIGLAWHFPITGALMAGLALYQYRNTLHEPPGTKEHKALFALPDKKMLHYAAIVFICMACENTMYDWSGVYFQQVMGSTTATATAAFAAYMVMMTIGRFAGDKIVNRIGIRQMLYHSAITLTTGFLIAVLFPNPFMGFIGFMMAGFGVSCIAPLVFSLAGNERQSSASALASISSISYLGFLLVPPLVGIVSEVIGIRISFGIIGCLAFVMILLIRLVKEDAHKLKEHTEETLL